MAFLADRLNKFEPSPTLAITARARELKAAGRDVIGFGAGEPDFDTPEHIRAAAVRAIAEGQTRYTNVGGTPLLKKTICEKFRRDNNLHYTPEEVTASNGGKQILFNLFLATLNPGDEVLLPAPAWVSYAEMIRFAEAVPVPIYAGPEQNYLITPEQLRAAITPKTRMFILNSPCNPTGATFAKKELAAICEVLLEHPNILIASDDIYEHIIFDGLRFYNPAMLVPELKDRTFIINGVSKAYSMTGWRIGVGAGPEEIVRNMEKIQGQCSSNPSSVSQAAAVAALGEDQECVETMRQAFEQRRDLVFRMLQSIDGIRAIKPQGAFYIFPDVSEIYEWPRFQKLLKDDPQKSRVFCSHLLDHYDVATVAGTAFGDDNAFRISYALDESSLRKGLERLGNMVNDLR
ncbi:MAG: pyridoxal phosphate-dependent aminotransferase [bacterium]|nr:pyridoxal phosphate-dependent aminotransferase [bacterium]